MESFTDIREHYFFGLLVMPLLLIFNMDYSQPVDKQEMIHGQLLAKQAYLTAKENRDKQLYQPLKLATPNGEGPLALPYLRSKMVGSASVFGSQQPDLFISGNTRSSDLFLFPWLRNNQEGVPVFDEPVQIESYFTSSGTVFQANDGVIHGLWLNGDSVIHTIFDLPSLSFIVKNKVKLPDLPGSPRSISAFLNSDESVDLVLEISGFRKPGKYQNQNASSENWRPYDEAGISSSGISYTYLCSVNYPKLLKGEGRAATQATPTNKEVLYRMENSAPVDFGNRQSKDLVCGSKLGTFSYYQQSNGTPLTFGHRNYMVGEDGNILRHPSVSASVCSYPQVNGKLSNIIAGGEGAVYFYQFTGEFTLKGDPIFKKPVPVLQQNADLYAGTLPSPTTIDWDGDNVLDIVAGNSEGFVLFFKNVGSNKQPEFLPGERIKAGGKEIQIQAGYSGSVQGTGEARWGYVSPNVVDWTEDGLPDIVMGDITGNYTIYINKGTRTTPVLDVAQSMYCDGLELHGMWRCRAAVGKFGDRMTMAIIDGDDHFHLYWKIDDFNVEDGGKILLDDGSKIITSAQPAGGTGRCKLDFFDYDNDGKLDLIIGNGRRSAIPNMTTGYPLPTLGNKTLGTPLFMKNVGTENNPIFEHPFPFDLEGVGLLQPGGSHESGAVGTLLGGGNQPNLLVGNEVGRLYLLQGDQLSLMGHDEAKKYRNIPNPLSDVKELKNKTDESRVLPTKENVHYGTHERQVLDFYKADSDKPTPLVIWIHGGGWVSGDKKNVHGLEKYLEAGISVVSVNYRYSWQAQLAGIEPPVKWPIDDAVRALQFVRSKATEWNIDKERIAASGSSAGATSSLYLAFHDDLADPDSSDPVARESTRLWCAGVGHPQTSLDPKQMIEWTPNSKYGGHAFGFMDPNDLKSRDKSFAKFLEKRDAVLKWIKMYSPYEHVSKDDPPIYMLYRSAPAVGQEQKDPTHTANFGVKLQEHCEELGVDCELVYPEKPNVIHEDFPEFLIEKLTE